MSEIRKLSVNQVQWEKFPVRIVPQRKTLLKGLLSGIALLGISGIYFIRYFNGTLEKNDPVLLICMILLFLLSCTVLGLLAYRGATGRLKLPIFGSGKNGLLRSTLSGYIFIPWHCLHKLQLRELKVKGATLLYVDFIWASNLPSQTLKQLKKKFSLHVDSKEQQQQVLSAVMRYCPQTIILGTSHA